HRAADDDAPVEAVGEGPSGEREHEQREDIHQAHEAECGGGVGPLVDLPHRRGDERLPTDIGEKMGGDISPVTWMPECQVRIARGPAHARGGTAGAAGRKTRKVEPWFGRLSTCSAPRWLRTMPRTGARPSPRPVNLVVKKGSKMRARTSGVMPLPLS